MHPSADQIVMSFASADDATVAVLRLHRRGFDAADVLCYTVAQMRRIALPGLPSNLVVAHRERAQRGFCVVIARAASETLIERAAWIARETHADSVQHQGRYRTEDLSGRSIGWRPAAPAPVTASAAPTSRWRTAARPSIGP